MHVALLDDIRAQNLQLATPSPRVDVKATVRETLALAAVPELGQTFQRMMLPTTELLECHCGDHTAKPESAPRVWTIPDD